MDEATKFIESVRERPVEKFVWPFALALRLRRSPLRAALLVATAAGLMPLINFLMVLPDPTISSREVYESIVVAIINTGVIGHCSGLLAWVLMRLPNDLLPLRPMLSVDSEVFAREVAQPLNRREILVVIVVTAVVWYFVNIELGAVGRFFRGEEVFTLVNTWNIAFFIGLWLLLIYTAVVLTRLANRLSELGRTSLRIDLLATHRLSPFMEIGQRTILLAVGGLSFALMQGALLGGLRPADWVPATILVILISIWLLLRPVWGVHLAIRDARDAELARLDQEIGFTSVVQPSCSPTPASRGCSAIASGFLRCRSGRLRGRRGGDRCSTSLSRRWPGLRRRWWNHWSMQVFSDFLLPLRLLQLDGSADIDP